MAKRKDDTVNDIAGTVYPREALITSKRYLDRYNKYFLQALLKKPTYTLAEADKIIEDYFGGK